MIDKILNPNTKAGDVFPNNEIQTKNIYRNLCKKYHPDVFHDPRADEIIHKINELYNQALELIKNGTWEKKNYIEIKTTIGKRLQISYQYHCIFELGEYYVCNYHIIYLFDFNKKKYYNNYVEKIKNLKYADSNMEKMFKNLFPKIVSEYDTLDNKHVIVLSKTSDVYPLRCVIENYFNGNVPDTHLAWIISRLMNICCYLKYSNIVCNGINLDSCFVSTDFHTILLFGGWWYATENGSPMIGTSKDIFNVMPPVVKANKISNFVTDVESVKAFGRKYLSSTAPQAFRDFVNSGTKENSMEEMEKWDKALLQSYGKRKFIKIVANKNQIYK